MNSDFFLYKILKSTPWRGNSPLDKLNSVFYFTTNPCVKFQKFRLTFEAIKTPYQWISLVLERMDSDLYSSLDLLNGNHGASKGENVDHYELLLNKSLETNVDIITLMLFITILMDELARLIKFSIIGTRRPETNNFQSLKETLPNFKGKHISEFNNIIQDTDWYSNLEDLRDYSISQSDKENILINEGEEIGVVLRFMVDGKSNKKFITNSIIDEYSEQAYNFLEKISIFLETNVEDLPLRTIEN